MTFNSWEFLIFYPITLLLYFLLPKKWSRISLLFMSAIFYLAWNYKLIVLIMFTTAVSYFCARIIEKTEKKAVKKLCLVVTLIACLGVLFFFKYYNFLAETLGWAIKAAGGGTYDFTAFRFIPSRRFPMPSTFTGERKRLKRISRFIAFSSRSFRSSLRDLSNAPETSFPSSARKTS